MEYELSDSFFRRSPVTTELILRFETREIERGPWNDSDARETKLNDH